MTCKTCSKRLQTDWKFCPVCGREVVISDDERLSSFGFKYLPEAFEPEPYRLGRTIAENASFYQVFIRYVLSVVSDITQLVHFRAQVIHETDRVASNKHNLNADHVRWCAFSLASDRYFADKALLYDWSATEEEQISSGWFDLIAPAFIPGNPNKRMEAGIVREWVGKFLSLHSREAGPLPTCGPCAAKCDFQYEVSEVTRDPKIKSDFHSSVHRQDISASDSAAWFSGLLTQRLIGKRNIDLSYCVSIHLIKDLDVPVPVTTTLSSDAQLILAHKVRNSLSAQELEESRAVAVGAVNSVRGQVLETVVRQALAGVPWQQICAGPMQANNITIEEVESEVHRRRSLS